MKSRGNIYAYSREAMLDAHAERLSGNDAGLVLVVYTEAPSEAAKNALDKSFAAIGYDNDVCLYADVDGLEAGNVFDLVEGIDPLGLIACDAKAAELCAQAVRQPFPPMQKMRLFGREARAFTQINAMLDTETDRQAVWHMLKSMA